MHNIFDSKEGQIAASILQTLTDAGYEAYAVGGCVRNYLLNLPIVDFDITTSAQPQEVISLFPKTLQTGIRFGTVTVVQDGDFVEVTTFRSEKNYEDTRHPSHITFEKSLIADLERRDFTMNAIACSLDGTFVDPFFGQADIKQHTIRCVGDPLQRMQEDLLRCVRAFRFAAQLGFAIEASTLAAIQKNSSHLKKVARERVAAEWHKMLTGTYPLPIHQMAESGWLSILDLSYTANDRSGWQQFLKTYKDLPNEATQLVSLAIFLRKTEQAMSEWLKSLCYGKEMMNVCKNLFQVVHIMQTEMSQEYTSEDQTFNKFQELLFHFGLHIVEQAVVLLNLLSQDSFFKHMTFDLSIIQKAFAKMPIKKQADLAINGRDLIDMAGRSGGPWTGQLLRKAAELVLHGLLANKRQALLSWAQHDLEARDKGDLNGPIHTLEN